MNHAFISTSSLASSPNSVSHKYRKSSSLTCPRFIRMILWSASRVSIIVKERFCLVPAKSLRAKRFSFLRSSLRGIFLITIVFSIFRFVSFLCYCTSFNHFYILVSYQLRAFLVLPPLPFYSFVFLSFLCPLYLFTLLLSVLCIVFFTFLFFYYLSFASPFLPFYSFTLLLLNHCQSTNTCVKSRCSKSFSLI